MAALKHGLLALGFAFARACAFLFFTTFAYAGSPECIRVAIEDNAVSLRVKITGAYEVVDPKSDKMVSRGRSLVTTVTPCRAGISIGAVPCQYQRVRLRVQEGVLIKVNGRDFKEAVDFIRKDNGRILAVNNINLEDYLKGILYHEVSHYWPEEALKAQAIACRSYAVYQAQQSSAREFDLTADVYSQIYGGSTSERFRTNRAVEETEGLILSFKGKVIPAYFHATCAGHTEDISLVWNADLPPLKGVACGFCKGSPHFKWHYVLSLEELQVRLAAAGYNIGKITTITILGRDRSSRVTELSISGENKRVKISAKDLRQALKPNFIRSTNFTLDIVGEDAVFEGFGWGHGVGMCQWGAYFMAKQGYRYEQILQFYYPGTQILPLTTRPGQLSGSAVRVSCPGRVGAAV